MIVIPKPFSSLLGLSGNLWPIHLKPLPDELLSSWLVRLAHGHGLKLQSFCSLVFGRDKSIWNRDIDKQAPEWLIVQLAEHTGTSIDETLQTTLKAYEGILYEHHQSNGNTKWILPLGVYHRARHSHGLQFCPHCLNEDVEPYFRKRWRLAFSIICTKHQCYLLDACPQCDSPIAPHRSDMQAKTLYPHGALRVCCWKCGFDLRTSLVTAVHDFDLESMQIQLESAMENGHTSWAGNQSMHSIVFFDGLRSLISGIVTKHTRERLVHSSHIDCSALAGWPRAQFEMTTQSQRRAFFHVFAIILKDWPKNFQSLIHESKLRYAYLKGDGDSRPYWFENVIKHEAGGGFAAISDNEILSITFAVEKQHGLFSLEEARAMSGRDLSKHITMRHVVSDETYEDLLVAIDHQIAGTFDKVERACLVRDKIMFATGRQLGLSERALSNLTLARIRVLAPQCALLDFSVMARGQAQVRAWVEWYWDNMRSNLQPEPQVVEIFTSIKTKRGLKHSAIGRRFEQAVDRAMMRSAISAYDSWKSGLLQLT